jgi:hypothetical protein
MSENLRRFSTSSEDSISEELWEPYSPSDSPRVTTSPESPLPDSPESPNPDSPESPIPDSPESPNSDSPESPLPDSPKPRLKKIEIEQKFKNIFKRKY